MNLSPRNKLILTAIGALVIVIALAAALVLPQVTRLGRLDADLSAAEQEAQSARTLLEQRFEVRNRAAATDARLMQLGTSFPENPELTSAIIELQDLAYDSDVEIRSFAPGQPVPRVSHIAIPLAVVIIGDWRETVDFTQQIMNLNRQYRIVGISSVTPPTLLDPAPEVVLEPYAVQTDIMLEAYVISASVGTSPTAPAVPAPAPAQ